MDFGYLLDLAKQNEDNSKDLANVKRFSTEPSKAKKLQKSKVNSGNIKRFLAQKEEEERQKLLEAKKKKEALLSLREQEKGAKRRVSAMLNRTKGANRSVLEDAKDKYNTAATLSGSYQPDEDDYGYESKASTEMFAKMLSKYEKIPDQDYLRDRRNAAKPQRSLDLNATKARVKQSLDNQEEEERNMKGHRRRKSKKDGEESEPSTSSSSKYRSPSPPSEKDREKKQKKTVKRSNAAPPPPGLDFQAIMRLAAEKQHQPVAVPEKKLKIEDEGRPMTAKEKIEMEETRKRELRKQGKLPPAKHKDYNNEFTIPKKRKGKYFEALQKRNEIVTDKDSEDEEECGEDKVQNQYTGREREREKVSDKDNDRDRDRYKDRVRDHDRERERSRPQSSPSSSGSRPKQNGLGPSHSDQQRGLPPKSKHSEPPSGSGNKRKPSPLPAPSVKRKPPPPEPKRKESPPPAAKRRQSPPPETKRKQSPPPVTKRKPSPPPIAKRKQFPPADVRRKQFPPADLKPRQFPPADLKPKQFPPADVKRKVFKPENMKRFAGGSGYKPNRIESDSEYDSEMDDFIDDGPLEGENDYSSAIREIFGYDKSKYRDVDEDDSDMEAGFSTVMQEEARSSKIAKQEDEAELRKEMEHKRRKMAMKKRAGR